MIIDVRKISLETLERGVVDESTQLSRRHRWKPVAHDVDGTYAAVAVVTRGKRSGRQLVLSQFRLVHGKWEWSGGGGGGSPSGPGGLGSRPSMTELPGFWYSEGNCSPHALVFRFVAEVAWVGVRSERRPVPDSGYTCIAWADLPPPAIPLFGADGQTLHVLALDRSALGRWR